MIVKAIKWIEAIVDFLNDVYDSVSGWIETRFNVVAVLFCLILTCMGLALKAYDVILFAAACLFVVAVKYQAECNERIEAINAETERALREQEDYHSEV